ncbi:MAG: aminopeptidase [Candidatus Dormibacteraceae bacterium]
MLPEYAPGARNAVRVCLGVGPTDRVAMIDDRDRKDISDAILEEAEAAGAKAERFTIEDWIDRPALHFPDPLRAALDAFAPTVSFFVGGGQPGELAFRHPLLEMVREKQLRHGHMIGITRELMLDGMAGDYEEIYRVTQAAYQRVKEARLIEVRTALGTDLRATFNPDWRWIPADGRYREPGQWGNLPEGEVFTAPQQLDGLLVGEEMGDHFAPAYGLFEEPVRIEVAQSRVRRVSMPGHPEIVREIEAYLRQHPESNRAAEFAIGTNVGLTRIVGNFLQDEKFPGNHVAFGDPYGSETGADWEAPSHVDVLASRADIWVDGERLMDTGKLLV